MEAFLVGEFEEKKNEAYELQQRKEKEEDIGRKLEDGEDGHDCQLDEAEDADDYRDCVEIQSKVSLKVGADAGYFGEYDSSLEQQ